MSAWYDEKNNNMWCSQKTGKKCLEKECDHLDDEVIEAGRKYGTKLNESWCEKQVHPYVSLFLYLHLSFVTWFVSFISSSKTYPLLFCSLLFTCFRVSMTLFSCSAINWGTIPFTHTFTVSSSSPDLLCSNTRRQNGVFEWHENRIQTFKTKFPIQKKSVTIRMRGIEFWDNMIEGGLMEATREASKILVVGCCSYVHFSGEETRIFKSESESVSTHFFSLFFQCLHRSFLCSTIIEWKENKKSSSNSNQGLFWLLLSPSRHLCIFVCICVSYTIWWFGAPDGQIMAGSENTIFTDALSLLLTVAWKTVCPSGESGIIIIVDGERRTWYCDPWKNEAAAATSRIFHFFSPLSSLLGSKQYVWWSLEKKKRENG